MESPQRVLSEWLKPARGASLQSEKSAHDPDAIRLSGDNIDRLHDRWGIARIVRQASNANVARLSPREAGEAEALIIPSRLQYLRTEWLTIAGLKPRLRDGTVRHGTGPEWQIAWRPRMAGRARTVSHLTVCSEPDRRQFRLDDSAVAFMQATE